MKTEIKENKYSCCIISIGYYESFNCLLHNEWENKENSTRNC